MAINFDRQRDRISTSSGVLTLNTTGAFAIPVGNTAQRPSVLSTGQIRFNSQQQIFEGYTGTSWSSLGGVRDTDDISEGSTNLYYTDARADARISAASINDLSDVDLTTPPTANQTIIWDAVNSKFIPGDSFSQDNFDSAFTAKSIGDLSDVDTATIAPRQGQVLIYDDNTSQWRPGSVSAGGGNTLFTLLNL